MPQRRGEHFVFSKDTGRRRVLPDLPLRSQGNGGTVTLLTDGKSRNMMGPFSRAGERLAYTSTRRNGKDTDLYVIDPRDPKSDRRLAEVEGGGWSPLDWSPDGKRLLVAQYVSVNESYLWIFDAASGERDAADPEGGRRAGPLRRRPVQQRRQDRLQRPPTRTASSCAWWSIELARPGATGR